MVWPTIPRAKLLTRACRQGRFGLCVQKRYGACFLGVRTMSAMAAGAVERCDRGPRQGGAVRAHWAERDGSDSEVRAMFPPRPPLRAHHAERDGCDVWLTGFQETRSLVNLRGRMALKNGRFWRGFVRAGGQKMRNAVNHAQVAVRHGVMASKTAKMGAMAVNLKLQAPSRRGARRSGDIGCGARVDLWPFGERKRRGA